MQKVAIAIGTIAILGVPAVTTAAPVDRSIVVAQEGKAAPPHHRKRILRRNPYTQNGPSHSSEHSDVDHSGGTSGSAAGSNSGGGSHDNGSGASGAGGGSHGSGGGGGSR